MADDNRDQRVEEKPNVRVSEPLAGGAIAASSTDDDSIREPSLDHDVERQEFQANDTQGEKLNTHTSRDLRRTASNVLSHVASRLTTRDWPEPPPPPDGGRQAWTQVAMGFLVIFTT
jgi:hypothetical protein